jgi:hypothetical protein
MLCMAAKQKDKLSHCASQAGRTVSYPLQECRHAGGGGVCCWMGRRHIKWKSLIANFFTCN